MKYARGLNNNSKCGKQVYSSYHNIIMAIVAVYCILPTLKDIITGSTYTILLYPYKGFTSIIKLNDILCEDL